VALALGRDSAERRRQENPSGEGVSLGSAEATARAVTVDGAEDVEVIEAARQLLAFARNGRFNYFEEAQNTLQFVQTVPYETDEATKGREYFRYALETLADNAGDCDCKAILAATIFRLMGLRSVILLSFQEGHAAVAVEGAPDFPGNRYFEWNGARYYFCETTDHTFSFTVGEVPNDVDLARYDTRIEIPPALMGRDEATDPDAN